MSASLRVEIYGGLPEPMSVITIEGGSAASFPRVGEHWQGDDTLGVVDRVVWSGAGKHGLVVQVYVVAAKREGMA